MNTGRIANSIESETLEELSGHYDSATFHYNPATVEYILRRVAINLAIIADQLLESNGKDGCKDDMD